MYLLYVFHKLQLQDAAGLQPTFLLPDCVLFAWDLSGDAGTAHRDTFVQSGQQESWRLVLYNSVNFMHVYYMQISVFFYL